ATVVLPFAFSFYGISSTVIRVGNNGGILFGTTGGDVPFGNAPLTATSAPDFFIAPFWDDIDSDFGNVYFKTVGTAPNRRFVVEWHNRPHYNLGSGSGGVTFQLILYEGTNAIKFQYQDVFFGSSAYDRGASATVGIRGGSTSQVVQYSFNQPVLTDTLAICFRLAGAPPCDAGDIPWLSAVPMQGVVPAASALSVNVGFDSRFVSPGVYTGFLQLHTNAPQAQPFIRYPVTMTVLEPYRSYVPLVRRP
ncbi:MAG: peptidase S8, partial [Anaerolineae bacterium]|nr:peptidase S8 [Anaerolineae bacterium]